MNESKGLNGYAKWLVGILFTIVFTIITTLTTAVIANDEKARDRDSKLSSDLSCAVQNQMLTNQQILVALAEISTEIKADRKSHQ